MGNLAIPARKDCLQGLLDRLLQMEANHVFALIPGRDQRLGGRQIFPGLTQKNRRDVLLSGSGKDPALLQSPRDHGPGDP
jgi:hypothetical protein